jgi:hypothetical protein
MRLAIDVSNYTAIPTAAQVDELIGLGVEGAIVGTSYGGVAARQIAAFEAGGIPCEEYQFPESIRPAVRGWWLDAETGGVTVPIMRALIAQKKPLGIYTRRGWWTQNTGDWNVKAEFPDLLLWDARYCHGDGPCSIDGSRASIEAEYALTPAYVPYGGFDAPSVTQWHDSVTIAGLNLDLDALEDQKVETDMIPYLVWNSTVQQTWLVGPFGACPILYPADATALQAVYGPHKMALTDTALKAIAAA